MGTREKHFSSKQFEINANWTASEPVNGFKHYRICSLRKNAETNVIEIELISVLDRSVRFFLEKQSLKKDSNWIPGWR